MNTAPIKSSPSNGILQPNDFTKPILWSLCWPFNCSPTHTVFIPLIYLPTHLNSAFFPVFFPVIVKPTLWGLCANTSIHLVKTY